MYFRLCHLPGLWGYESWFGHGFLQFSEGAIEWTGRTVRVSFALISQSAKKKRKGSHLDIQPTSNVLCCQQLVIYSFNLSNKHLGHSNGISKNDRVKWLASVRLWLFVRPTLNMASLGLESSGWFSMQVKIGFLWDIACRGSWWTGILSMLKFVEPSESLKFRCQFWQVRSFFVFSGTKSRKISRKNNFGETFYYLDISWGTGSFSGPSVQPRPPLSVAVWRSGWTSLVIVPWVRLVILGVLG